LEVMVKAVLTVFVPSETVIVCAPPGIAGTVAVTWNPPLAVVVRHSLPAAVVARLSAVPRPLSVVVHVPAVSQATAEEPTVL
jgi:hypothetical protein